MKRTNNKTSGSQNNQNNQNVKNTKQSQKTNDRAGSEPRDCR